MANILPTAKIWTPDKVISMLFYLHNQAHFNHLQTRKFARHKALDKLYKGLEEFKDEISELLLGYIAPGRIGKLEHLSINPTMSDEQLLDYLCKFADELYEYGEQTKWWALSNMAAELSGLGYKVKYLLTLA
jgi:DNA-binding ferritin-like protein